MTVLFRQSITDTSPAAPSTVVGAGELINLSDFPAAKLIASLTGATGGALDVFVQMFDGIDWMDVCHFDQLPAAAPLRRVVVSIPRAGLQTEEDIGFNVAPALPQNRIVSGEFGARFRMLFVAGAGTTAGAAQTLTLIGAIA